METTWITLLKEIMQTVVVPLMGILTVFLCITSLRNRFPTMAIHSPFSPRSRDNRQPSF